ncbi:universal stress protein [Microbacterium sp. JZ31]|uniref:universal stress protein n=1 Tax=Microbacterium sp. JZ31 TaxID=1906274 RepID=UPI0019321A1D|nr:universal stress protein [Microbacterium sp. JZ31]
MTDQPSTDEPSASARAQQSAVDAALRGAVIAAIIPDQSPRVLQEAAHYAALLGAPLAVVHVDVTRFVTYEDPDGYVHSAPVDINVQAGEGELQVVRANAESVLVNSPVAWEVRQLVGDPALAIKHFADKIDAKLIVVGTRKRGFGESIRQFFTGSVAARLSHRQHRAILVVPQGELLQDHEDFPEVEG